MMIIHNYFFPDFCAFHFFFIIISTKCTCQDAVLVLMQYVIITGHSLFLKLILFIATIL